ncbi:uncharacterized protein HD556DRAFT_529901 [Suillus plorans]|uniref:Secreted protein n=1 Tax=Suillus plorans TaxID=116603 RepID=A0A9P7APG7_9AGAM|nr:uncharacterized protein HD556DRAFT_529901 [Suillus plorans]KAG1792945.1 hypothetical protein HD556DRAFT_529901 [Suillus plorans]
MILFQLMFVALQPANAATMAKQAYKQASSLQFQRSATSIPPHLVVEHPSSHYPSHCELVLCLFFTVHLPHMTGEAFFFHVSTYSYICSCFSLFVSSSWDSCSVSDFAMLTIIRREFLLQRPQSSRLDQRTASQS